MFPSLVWREEGWPSGKTILAWGLGDAGSIPCTTADILCDLKQVTLSLLCGTHGESMFIDGFQKIAWNLQFL